MRTFRSGTVTQQVQASDGTVEVVVVQVNVVPVSPQDDMQVVAGAAVGTVNPYPVTMVLRISEIPRCRSLEFPRGRAVRRAWDELTGLSSPGLLSGELGDGDRLVAAGTGPAGSGPAHECAACVAALLAEGAVPAAAAFIDGDRPPRPWRRHCDGRWAAVTAAPVGSCPAGVAAVGPAPRRGEGGLADRAGQRDAIVTRRGPGPAGAHGLATARRVASARARWERIR